MAAALAFAALPAGANALPPHCEKYADKPCFTFCEIWEDVERLWTEPIPPVNGC